MIPEIPVHAIVDAIDSFANDVHSKKSDVAKALDMNPSDLSASHLSRPMDGENRCRNLLWRLRRNNLPNIAVKLKLDLKGCRHLEALSNAITKHLSGFEVVSIGEKSRSEAVYLGWR